MKIYVAATVQSQQTNTLLAQATPITASFHATNLSPEIHSGRHLCREIHPRSNIWEKKIQWRLQEGCAHQFLSTAHHLPTPAIALFPELDSFTNMTLSLAEFGRISNQFWSWIPLHVTFSTNWVPNIKSSPVLGKVGPPVDHHPTHLLITRAAQHEREVEQG